MSGRPQTIDYSTLNFKMIKERNKNVAYCFICQKNLQNTALNRLKAHRYNVIMSHTKPYQFIRSYHNICLNFRRICTLKKSSKITPTASLTETFEIEFLDEYFPSEQVHT